MKGILTLHEKGYNTNRQSIACSEDTDIIAALVMASPFFFETESDETVGSYGVNPIFYSIVGSQPFPEGCMDDPNRRNGRRPAAYRSEIEQSPSVESGPSRTHSFPPSSLPIGTMLGSFLNPYLA